MPLDHVQSEIVARLREVRDAGVKLTARGVRAHDSKLYEDIFMHIGSLAEARRLVDGGAPDPEIEAKLAAERQWVLDTLRDGARRGVRWGDKALREHGGLRYKIARSFGSLERAMAAADLPPVTTPWTRERLVDVLRAHHARVGHVSHASLQADGLGHVPAVAFRLFGGLQAARKAAGAPGPPPRWTKERVIRELRAASRGRPITATDLEGRGLHSLRHYAEWLFGGMAAARDAAGVPHPPPQLVWTPERVLEELRALDRAGVPLKSAALARSHGGLVHRVMVYFGCMAGAELAAGLEPVVRRVPWLLGYRLGPPLLEGDSVVWRRSESRFRLEKRVHFDLEGRTDRWDRWEALMVRGRTQVRVRALRWLDAKRQLGLEMRGRRILLVE